MRDFLLRRCIRGAEESGFVKVQCEAVRNNGITVDEPKSLEEARADRGESDVIFSAGSMHAPGGSVGGADQLIRDVAEDGAPVRRARVARGDTHICCRRCR